MRKSEELLSILLDHPNCSDPLDPRPVLGGRGWEKLSLWIFNCQIKCNTVL